MRGFLSRKNSELGASSPQLGEPERERANSVPESAAPISTASETAVPAPGVQEPTSEPDAPVSQQAKSRELVSALAASVSEPGADLPFPESQTPPAGLWTPPTAPASPQMEPHTPSPKPETRSTESLPLSSESPTPSPSPSMAASQPVKPCPEAGVIENPAQLWTPSSSPRLCYACKLFQPCEQHQPRKPCDPEKPCKPAQPCKTHVAEKTDGHTMFYHSRPAISRYATDSPIGSHPHVFCPPDEARGGTPDTHPLLLSPIVLTDESNDAPAVETTACPAHVGPAQKCETAPAESSSTKHTELRKTPTPPCPDPFDGHGSETDDVPPTPRQKQKRPKGISFPRYCWRRIASFFRRLKLRLRQARERSRLRRKESRKKAEAAKQKREIERQMRAATYHPLTNKQRAAEAKKRQREQKKWEKMWAEKKKADEKKWKKQEAAAKKAQREVEKWRKRQEARLQKEKRRRDSERSRQEKKKREITARHEKQRISAEKQWEEKTRREEREWTGKRRESSDE
ncbi:hypothetical protein QBC47DRAFT_413177 [Echria macrotheca]|uniref:Uncharacterized protein n=1 Tax=Echria macrotheca TaxID=438768 RepID=A0AAJ0BCN2_9PEZI|nr:hypothetical protein QBC47DRAFT_413177 [Echria macrotheca]